MGVVLSCWGWGACVHPIVCACGPALDACCVPARAVDCACMCARTLAYRRKSVHTRPARNTHACTRAQAYTRTHAHTRAHSAHQMGSHHWTCRLWPAGRGVSPNRKPFLPVCVPSLQKLPLGQPEAPPPRVGWAPLSARRLCPARWAPRRSILCRGQVPAAAAP